MPDRGTQGEEDSPWKDPRGLPGGGVLTEDQTVDQPSSPKTGSSHPSAAPAVDLILNPNPDYSNLTILKGFYGEHIFQFITSCQIKLWM